MWGIPVGGVGVGGVYLYEVWVGCTCRRCRCGWSVPVGGLGVGGVYL